MFGRGVAGGPGGGGARSFRLAVTGLVDTEATGDLMRMGHHSRVTVAEPAPPSDVHGPSDAAQTAHPITSDVVADDPTLIPRDVDWFSCPLAVSKVVSANAVVTRHGDLRFDAILALLDTHLERIDVGWQRVGAYLQAERYDLGVAPHGHWDMTGAHGCTGDDRREVVATEPPAPAAMEPNDDLDHVAERVIGSGTPLVRLVPGDVDWFRFTVSSQRLIELAVFPHDIGAGGGVPVWLLDGGSEVLAFADEWSPCIMGTVGAATYDVIVTRSPDRDRIGDHGQACCCAIDGLDDPGE